MPDAFGEEYPNLLLDRCISVLVRGVLVSHSHRYVMDQICQTASVVNEGLLGSSEIGLPCTGLYQETLNWKWQMEPRPFSVPLLEGSQKLSQSLEVNHDDVSI